MKGICAAMLALVLAVPAAAQGIPEGLRGSWSAGGCAAPAAVLHLTARAAVRLPEAGSLRLWRFTALREAGGWVIGTATGAEAPRLLLRGVGPAALETAEPEAKTRDDRLPGDAPVEAWTRCAAPPTLAAVLHGEGLAALAALEAIEAGCAGPAAGCVAAVIAAADLGGDGLLGTAEIARLLRGLGWVVAAAQGSTAAGVGSLGGIGAVAAVASARLLVESLDYDGDGRLSAAELGQDRTAFGAAAGNAAGVPLRLEALAPGFEALRELLEAVAPER